MNSIMKFILPIIIGLSIVGLIISLFNPLALLRQLLWVIVIVGLIFFVYRLVMSRRYGTPLFPSRSGPTRAQIRKAKKTSQHHNKQHPSKRHTNVQPIRSKKKPEPLIRKKRPDHNFKVIEGKKNKKKNRALF
ncbi:SA1362 family protein [Halalkalibacter hemicellulosilyticus]|uniref:Uncharacterized protein n=1 Tax=Halalkalibacter hemicellulosilyticusJCM 9152 TaxID=1236971 RepID=W4QIA7_9BACI|nr:SA1362 family protein [Halalkalibacter hemicellulosilyticus]GAE31860.1 hypothetical protein JCM9152_3355 [Halalkalibacter hemicellulosilyticusJCM 9152]